MDPGGMTTSTRQPPRLGARWGPEAGAAHPLREDPPPFRLERCAQRGRGWSARMQQVREQVEAAAPFWYEISQTVINVRRTDGRRLDK